MALNDHFVSSTPPCYAVGGMYYHFGRFMWKTEPSVGTHTRPMLLMNLVSKMEACRLKKFIFNWRRAPKVIGLWTVFFRYRQHESLWQARFMRPLNRKNLTGIQTGVPALSVKPLWLYWEKTLCERNNSTVLQWAIRRFSICPKFATFSSKKMRKSAKAFPLYQMLKWSVEQMMKSYHLIQCHQT